MSFKAEIISTSPDLVIVILVSSVSSLKVREEEKS